jgi:hypothetical protein
MNKKYTYKIVRYYHDAKKERVLRTFVTQKHAKEHCSNPEASSKTCSKPANCQRTYKVGPWSDNYVKTTY